MTRLEWSETGKSSQAIAVARPTTATARAKGTQSVATARRGVAGSAALSSRPPVIT